MTKTNLPHLTSEVEAERDAALAQLDVVLASLPIEKLPGWYRSAAALAEAGTNAEAQAIGVTELMKALDVNGEDTRSDE